MLKNNDKQNVLINIKIWTSKEELDSFESLTKEQTIQWLKSILSTIVVITYKVAQFHWTMRWDKFLYVHPMFWTLYEDIDEQTDIIAERLRQLWANPLFTLKKSLDYSVIDEWKEWSVTPDEAIEITKNDFKEFVILLKAFAEKVTDDLATQQIVIDLQMFYDKQVFLLESEQ